MKKRATMPARQGNGFVWEKAKRATDWRSTVHQERLSLAGIGTAPWSNSLLAG
ncbi:hypothetical protein RY831_29470 [Noviherbaspirillum sp. CPCC 100848]|uniref:Uncharacterized protein n=1 Tax=Noviherbaspirillum album TaxID=3080276 RepID=A0ABU6JIK0_9BURK|nr:hypothetical protein [Noviherbaspirillum sp. CPCC 100848]MEC4723291.1 hypothetical protein [Noviherbaspirillum sp. CPCC 100848]